MMPATNVGTSDDLLADLSGWGEVGGRGGEGEGGNGLMEGVEGAGAEGGGAMTRIAGRDGYGDNLVARTPGEGKPVLVAGRLDTGWSHGTLETMPYAVNGM